MNRLSVDQIEKPEKLDISAYRSCRIMTIDDEPLICRSITVRLRMAGFLNVTKHTDDRTAFEAIQDFQPQVLLLDIMMPNVDGINLLRRLREAGMLENMLVIMLSGADIESKCEALKIGAVDYVDKPIDSQDLVIRIWHALVQASEKLGF